MQNLEKELDEIKRRKGAEIKVSIPVNEVETNVSIPANEVETNVSIPTKGEAKVPKSGKSDETKETKSATRAPEEESMIKTSKLDVKLSRDFELLIDKFIGAPLIATKQELIEFVLDHPKILDLHTDDLNEFGAEKVLFKHFNSMFMDLAEK